MQLFANNADSELNGGIDAVATSITLKTGGGTKFPTPTGGDFFLVTLYEKVAGVEVNHEIMKCTTRTGDVLTVVRSQEGTTARAFATATVVELRETAGTLTSKESLSSKDATGGYAGLTLFKLNLKNAANTFTNFLTNATTAARTWTFPDKDGTVAMASDITGGTSAGSFTSLADAGNLAFTGTGNRITGDFSNATFANRVMFQSSVVNGNTAISALPNGTGAIGQFHAYGGSDPANASRLTLSADTTNSRCVIDAGVTGTGTYLPMAFYTGGTEKLRIAADTTGTYTFGGTAPRITGDFSNATVANRVMFQTSVVNALTYVGVAPNGSGNGGVLQGFAASDVANTAVAQMYANSSRVSFDAAITGTGTYLPMAFYTGGSQRLRIDTSGNVTLSSATGGLGYGTGAGGTVTQATSKSTTVTLNKPTGQITMNAAALAAGASVAFNLSNSLISTQDVVYVNTAINGNYRVEIAAIASGVAQIRVTNITAGSLSEGIVVNFAKFNVATS